MADRSGRSFPNNPDDERRHPFRTALFRDAAALVWVVADDTTLISSNELAAAFLEQKGDSAEPQATSLHALLDGELSDEFAAHIADVARCGQARCVRTLLRGSAFMITLRPCRWPGSNREDLVLVTCAPSHELTSLNNHLNHDEPVELEHSDLGPLAHLTKRELEVLRFIGDGLTVQQIADRMHRGVKTIETHRTALGRKLGVRNRIELARIAIMAGLSEPSRAG